MIVAPKTHYKPRWLKPWLLAMPMLAVCMACVADERWQSLAQPVFQTIEHNARPLDGPIRATAQDGEGYIWLVSDNTLWRWDAYQLVPVRFDLQKTKFDLAPDVQMIKSDPNGEVWVGTSKGLYRIKQNPLRLQRVDVSALNDQAIDQIQFDFSSGKQRLFLSNEFSVMEWQVGSQSIHLLSIGQDVENRVHAMAVDAHAQLWVGTSNGLFVKSLKDPSQQPLRLVRLASDVQRISALYTDANQQLWIGTAKDGVYLLNAQQQIQRIALPKQSNNPWIYDITEARPGVLWFGTFGKGILEYHVATQTFNSIRQQRGLKRNLLDNDIWSFFKDRRGLIWIGSRRGVSMYNPTQSAFQYIPGDMGNPNGLLDSQIFSVLASQDDQLWLGTSANGIQIISPEKGLIQQLSPGQRFGAGTIPDDAIESIFQADDNTILAGSNWNTLRIKRTPLSVQALILPGRAEDTFSNAFAVHHGNLWVGGIDGLWRMPGFDQRQAVNVSRGKSVDFRVATLLSTNQALWVGTWRGMYQV
nr:hypothetical protein [Arenimonas sp.]